MLCIKLLIKNTDELTLDRPKHPRSDLEHISPVADIVKPNINNLADTRTKLPTSTWRWSRHCDRTLDFPSISETINDLQLDRLDSSFICYIIQVSNKCKRDTHFSCLKSSLHFDLNCPFYNHWLFWGHIINIMSGVIPEMCIYRKTGLGHLIKLLKNVFLKDMQTNAQCVKDMQTNSPCVYCSNMTFTCVKSVYVLNLYLLCPMQSVIKSNSRLF